MLYQQSLLIVGLISFINGFDKNVKIAELFNCKELLLEGDFVNEVYPISSLMNNNPEKNEIIRMKFYVLGHDMHVRLSDEDNFELKHYLAYFDGNGGTGNIFTSGIAVTDLKYNSWNLLTVTETNDLTDMFYYTMLRLVVTENGVLTFYKNNNSEIFLSAEMGSDFHPKYISFSRSQFEENSRIFFDCPDTFQKEDSSEYDDDLTEHQIDFYAMRTMNHGNCRFKGSSVFGVCLLFVFLSEYFLD